MSKFTLIFWFLLLQWSVKPFKAYSKPTVLSFSILQASNSNKLPNYPLHIANPRSMCYLQHILTGCVTLMHIDQVMTYPCVFDIHSSDCIACHDICCHDNTKWLTLWYLSALTFSRMFNRMFWKDLFVIMCYLYFVF